MKDFKAGRDINVGGNVIISDHSNQEVKPLCLCNIEELLQEQKHRQNLLDEEIQKKKSVSNFFTVIALVVGLCIAIWYFIAGKAQLAMFIVGIIGVIFPIYCSINSREEISEFETRQTEALKEISYLLRERGHKPNM